MRPVQRLPPTLNLKPNALVLRMQARAKTRCWRWRSSARPPQRPRLSPAQRPTAAHRRPVRGCRRALRALRRAWWRPRACGPAGGWARRRRSWRTGGSCWARAWPRWGWTWRYAAAGVECLAQLRTGCYIIHGGDSVPAALWTPGQGSGAAAPAAANALAEVVRLRGVMALQCCVP